MINYPFIRVMAEYGSSGLWAQTRTGGVWRHGMISHQAAGISQGLAAAFDAWIEQYETQNLSGALDATFDSTGRDLARALKQELGEAVTVVYAPNADPQTDEPIA